MKITLELEINTKIEGFYEVLELDVNENTEELKEFFNLIYEKSTGFLKREIQIKELINEGMAPEGKRL